MRPSKVLKDWIFKMYLQSHHLVPSGLADMQKYFRQHGPIEFQFHKEDGMLVAVSKNFRFGSIVTYGHDVHELDEKIPDAILTSFGIPSSYANEAAIRREGAAIRREGTEQELAYAAA